MIRNSPIVISALLLLASGSSFPLFSQNAQKPDENRFMPVVVVDHGKLDEPMVFEVLRDGTVYIAERKGTLKMYDPSSDTTVLVDSISVNHTYVNAAGEPREAEEGLVGFTVDPSFTENHWAYFLYAHPTVAKHVLSRMELRGSTLLKETETVLLEFDAQRETCCHTGGGMTWDADGNLYITIGNNTGNQRTVQTDQRAGRMNWDDQRGSANTNDLRGKILRIHPQPDGTYTIPEGNLFSPGTPSTRPEIYAMGLRNAWRVSVDSYTGYVYWGEVGPDAEEATDRTVEGYDELNQARHPGFFGWPYFIGPNRSYPIIDYETDEVLPPQDPARPINDSRWNDGVRELSAAQPAFIAYPYAVSEEFPELGTGGRCAVGGPILRRSDFAEAARPWPEYYEGDWFAADCVRNWIMAITMDENGDYASMERFLPTYVPIEPLDLKFGPDGDLYVLEYGSVWFAKSPDSRLVRIEYNAGNRPPVVAIAADSKGGAVPFSVKLSSEGTEDPDGDPLSYAWHIAPQTNTRGQTFTTPNAELSFDRPGVYTAALTVRDPEGATASDSLRIVAGNEPPQVLVNVDGNRSFFFLGEPIQYSVEASDREDEMIASERVALSIDRVPEGFDLSALTQGSDPVSETTRFAVPEAIMSASDCRACHQPETRSVGPSFLEIATRYAGDDAALPRLVAKVLEGGSGEWGDIVMPAHPGLSEVEAAAVIRYMLGLNRAAPPLSGSYTAETAEGESGPGAVVIRAVYTDGGSGDGLPPQTSEDMIVLRSPLLQAGAAELMSAAMTTQFSARTMITSVVPKTNEYIGFSNLDLTGVRRIELVAETSARVGYPGGIIEIRLDSPNGDVIAEAQVAPAAPEGQGGGGGRGDRGTPPLSTDIPAVGGMHDLYFVFKNDEARPIEPLMSLSTITLLRQ